MKQKLFTVDIIHCRFNQRIVSTIFFLVNNRYLQNKLQHYYILFLMEIFGKFENVCTFKHYTFGNLRIDVLASVLFSSSLIDQSKNSLAS